MLVNEKSAINKRSTGPRTGEFRGSHLCSQKIIVDKVSTVTLYSLVFSSVATLCKKKIAVVFENEKQGKIKISDKSSKRQK